MENLAPIEDNGTAGIFYHAPDALALLYADQADGTGERAKREKASLAEAPYAGISRKGKENRDRDRNHPENPHSSRSAQSCVGRRVWGNEGDHQAVAAFGRSEEPHFPGTVRRAQKPEVVTHSTQINRPTRKPI